MLTRHLGQHWRTYYTYLSISSDFLSWLGFMSHTSITYFWSQPFIFLSCAIRPYSEYTFCENGLVYPWNFEKWRYFVIFVEKDNSKAVIFLISRPNYQINFNGFFLHNFYAVLEVIISLLHYPENKRYQNCLHLALVLCFFWCMIFISIMGRV